MTQFDKEKALKFGADKYGMRKYVMAFLKRGPRTPSDPKESEELQRLHLENIGRMAESRKLIVAGPYLDHGDLRGIYIFNVSSIEEAQELTNTDPAIIHGSLVMELKEWYGSAALMAVNDIHKEIAEEEI